MARSALITGAAQGLGAVIARALHGAGYDVAVTDVDAKGAAAVAAELDASGESAFGGSLDVRDEAAFDSTLAQMIAKWGRADVLINNAVVTAVKPVLDITPDEFDAVMAVNVRGTFIGCQVFGRHFRDTGSGRIVNIASLAGQNGGAATGAHYAASKGAIITLTKVFARDLAPFGVTVNAVAPGPLDVPSVHALLPPDKLQAVIKTIPAGHLGAPDFVADMVLKLASEEAAFVTGATWDVNGGLFMR
jgi:3-oxoacyl-[acyl-carrier protein] reductase